MIMDSKFIELGVYGILKISGVFNAELCWRNLRGKATSEKYVKGTSYQKEFHNTSVLTSTSVDCLISHLCLTQVCHA
jgi:hypothetical protein